MVSETPAISTASELVRHIEETIASGELSPGDPLPTVRGQAETLNLAPNTVAAAYRKLRDRGVLVGRGRQGTKVAPVSGPDFSNYPAPDADLIDAMTGNPDPAHLPDLATIAAKLEPRPPTRYGDPMIDPQLAGLARQAFAADGISCDHLALCSGAMDAVERTLTAQGLRVGDPIGVEDPGHGPVHALARRMGLELIGIPVDEFGITPTGLKRALSLGIEALVITPRAQNPTGAAFTPQRANELRDAMSDYPNLALIQDDHAGDISGVALVTLKPPGPRWAVIRSVSKSYGPDLRLAMIAGNAPTIQAINTSVAGGPSWVSHLLQRITASLMSNPENELFLAQSANSYSERRELLISELANYGISASGRSGLNVWIPVDDEQPAVDAVRRVGFAIRSSDSYRISSPTAVRVTISSLNLAQIKEVASALGSSSVLRSPTV